MNVNLCLSIVVYHLGEGVNSKEIRIEYLPRIPKLLLSVGLKHMKTGDEVQQALKRRFVRLTSNSIVPVNMLSKINELNVDLNQFQRAKLPLSSWRDQIQSVTSNPLAQDALTCACLFISQNISEATLRLRVWDALIKAFVSDITLMESEYHLEKNLNFSNIVKANLALVIKKFKIPAFVAEIGKEMPCGGFEHKDFVKLGTIIGSSCLKLAENLHLRGQNPLEAITFGSLIGYTSFKFLVATPQRYFNQKYGREEIFINLSFYDHWKMDLIATTADTNCSSDCCHTTMSGIILPTTQMDLEPLVSNDNLEVSLDEPTVDQAEPVEGDASSNTEEYIVQAEAEEVQQDQAEGEQVAQELQDVPIYNMEAVCKLKIFIECANQAAAHFETLLNLPVLPDTDGRIHFPSTEPLIEKSLEKGSSKTPSSKKVRYEDNRYLNGIGNSASLRTGKLEKPASREIDVYRAIPAHYKIFFPLLHDFQIDPEDPKNHIFIIESLKPLLKSNHRLETVLVLRTDSLRKLILEAATFAVHILFDLFILHEKVGWIHSDVSPNNIMFSDRLGIWKLIDFDLSLPIEESLKTPRRAGTRDFKAPESIRTKIWTQASDVFALGKVIQYVFGDDEMRKFNVTSSQVDFQAFKEFNQLINNMCSDNVNLRSSVRVALKSWIDFVFKYEVEEFQIYGYNLIFPLAIEELKNSPASSDSISFTRISINNEY